MTESPNPTALQPPSATSRAGTVVLIVLLVGIALVAALSFQRTVQSFQPLGLQLESTEGGWRVADSYRSSSLVQGDLLVTIDGEPVTSLDQARELLSRGLVTDVTFQREEDLLEGMHRRPPLRVDFAYMVLALIGVAYLFIGLYTLLRGLDRQVVLFVLWCACSALLYLVKPTLSPVDNLDLGLYLLDTAARALLPPLTLHFFLIFPRPLRLSGGRAFDRRMLPVLYLPAAVLLLLQTDMALGWRLLVPTPTLAFVLLLERIGLVLIVGFALMATVALITQSRHSKGWEERQQILWIAAGMAAGYLPFGVFYVLQYLLQQDVPQLLQVAGVMPLALVPLGFAWALLRYRLWDVAIILRNATTYALTLMLGGIGFSILSLLIRNQIPSDWEWTRNLSTIAGGLLVAGLLVPTKQSIGATLERFQYRGAFQRRRALADLGQELLYERDLEQLCANLTRQLEDTMGLERCNLFLLREDEFHPVTPESLTANLFLPQEAIGPRFWELDWIRIEQQNLPTLDPDIEDELFSYGYRIAFPLRVRERAVGILASGHKTGHTPLTSADNELIRQILNQAALAIENAQLLEQMQKRLRQVLELQQFNAEIIESSPAGIAVLDEDGRITHSNAAFAALVQSSVAELADRRIEEVLPVELPQSEAGLLETTLDDALGRERNVQLSTAKLHGARDNGDRVLVVNDVTELTQMERTLQEKERLAALGVMAAGVAHEVNTPLTGISSYAQMLLQDTDQADPRFSILKKMERQTFRASRIVGNLLELSRSSRPIFDQIALRPLIEECVEVLLPRLESRGLKITIEDSFTPELTTSGDEGELLQVFNNLLLNAAEASVEELDEDANAEITVTADQTESHVEIHVLDRGPGISAKNLPKIFRPFFSTKLDRGGTGLGLSISYEIVRRHGGELKASNREDGGCCFTVLLPKPGTNESPTDSGSFARIH